MSAPGEIPRLWEWTLGRYRRDGVSTLCLALQERHGADVNLLFLALWLAARGRALGPTDDPAAAVESWHRSVVLPLRQARRAMKDWPMPEHGPTPEDRDGVRAKLQAAEIETERLELGLLEAWAATAELAGADADAETALANLRRVMAAAPDDPDLARLADLTA
ncbi:TIGR02444 family protein [Jiella sonneratiae]|uniref:TIGR02444 family protein n=1 Tax=Jiella sonneratiae TaxID=2816856 RepID=A0ABS3J249_9HYPH|nr:TIGR02444 family protein [Jiella sonneratiae]MBO0903754.1 TIGR02444 family protein [Jiella sonneratiae]